MAATVSQTDQRRLRRQQAASLWLRGVPQTQIATQLGVSSQTIARDLRVIRQEWVQTRVTDWEMAREIELRKLDALEREAWEAWDRSQRHAETNKVSGSGADLGEKRRGEKISHSRTGDAKYLDVVARCIDRRCALLGINSLPGTNAPIVVQTAEIRQATLECNAQGLLWRLSVLDRRWKWAFPTISGVYNVRLDTADASVDPIVSGTEQTPQQLATLLLTAMGEQDFDVGDMPNDQRPTVGWDGANAARELANLADSLNCRVVLQLDDTVAIRVAGEGDDLPEGGVMEDSLTIDPPERPDSIGIRCAPTRYQIDVPLLAVGLDTDNTVRPINQLSYAPSGGWAGADFPALQSLKATNYAAWERAAKSVLRWYQIQFPITVAGVGEVDSVQLLALFDEQVNLIDDPGSADYRRLPAQVFGVWWTQGEIQTDNLVSLYPASVNTLPAIDPSNLDSACFYQGGVTLDRQRAIVMFPEPLHSTPRTVAQSTGSSSGGSTGTGGSGAAFVGTPAQLYLRTSTKVRDSNTGGWLCYERVQQFGDQFGTATQFEPHGELELNVVPVYSPGGFTISDTADDSELIDAQCDAYIDALNAQYATENPESRRYNSLVDVELDGAIQQVLIDLSTGGFTMTISRSSELLHRSVSYQERRMLERSQALKTMAGAARGTLRAWGVDGVQQFGNIV